MFGGDWPVSLGTAPYRDLVAATRACLAPLTETERDAVFSGTARRVYRFDAEPRRQG